MNTSKLCSFYILLSLLLTQTKAFSTHTPTAEESTEILRLQASFGYDHIVEEGRVPQAFQDILLDNTLSTAKREQLRFIAYELFSENANGAMILTGSMAMIFWANYYHIPHRGPNDIDLLVKYEGCASKIFPNNYVAGIKRNYAALMHSKVKMPRSQTYIIGAPGFFDVDVLNIDDPRFKPRFRNGDEGINYINSPLNLLASKTNKLNTCLEDSDHIGGEEHAAKIEALRADIETLNSIVGAQNLAGSEAI